jgi:hypothetical protein
MRQSEWDNWWHVLFRESICIFALHGGSVRLWLHLRFLPAWSVPIQLLIYHLIESLLQIVSLWIFLKVVKPAHSDYSCHFLIFFPYLLVKHHNQVVFFLCELSILEFKLFYFSLSAD